MYKQHFTKPAIGAILVLTLGVRANTAAERLSLVQDGRPSATIVLPEAPTQIEKSASVDLQRCLRRMSGAVLPIVAEPEQPQGIRVEIGATEHGRRLREELSRAQHRSEEVCVIKVTDEAVVLVGRNDAATGHAVYSLLERLGVRWLQPSLAWEIVPRRKTVSLRTGREMLAPYFDRRGGLAVSPTKMDETWSDSTQSWARRNRMGGWDHIGSGHSYNSLVPRDRFKDHPEYFGFWQGKAAARCSFARPTQTSFGWPLKERATIGVKTVTRGSCASVRMMAIKGFVNATAARSCDLLVTTIPI